MHAYIDGYKQQLPLFQCLGLLLLYSTVFMSFVILVHVSRKGVQAALSYHHYLLF